VRFGLWVTVVQLGVASVEINSHLIKLFHVFAFKNVCDRNLEKNPVPE
jgi:hypothetical protein